jgi:hypothetical protein
MKRLLEFLRVVNHPCREMTAHISHALDDPQVPWSIRLAYRIHLLYCTACRRYRRQLGVLREALQRLRPDGDLDVTGGPTLPAEARERIARALRSR